MDERLSTSRFRPATMTRPSVVRSRAMISLMNVVLPAPEGPERKTNSPSWIRTVTSRKASMPLG